MPLTDEHVVPFGIAGNALVFQKASCDPCRLLIHPFETAVLTKMWGRFRERAGSPTRNKKSRKGVQNLTFALLDEHSRPVSEPIEATIEVGVAPVFLNDWLFPLPTILTGSLPAAGQPWTYLRRGEVKTLCSIVSRRHPEAAQIALKVGEVPKLAYMRFLAKTAHAYAMATGELEQAKPLLSGVILGRDREAHRYIGSEQEIPPRASDDEVFQIRMGKQVREDKTIILAAIRAFPFLGTPQHILAVGERERRPDERPILQEGAHRKPG